jgi:acyl-homoserine lactone acylase PvdQ
MNKFLRVSCQVFVALVAIIFVSVWYLYQPLVSGTIYLKNAPGVASISYEEDTGISHIRGANLESTIYAQGFSHA